MHQIWTQHLQTEDDKQRFINQLHGAREVLDRLKFLIELKEKELAAAERNQSAYENPSWAFLQAHRNGYASAMTIIKNLLHLDHQKNEHSR